MNETLKLSNRLSQLKLEGLRNNIAKSNQVADIINRHLAERPFHLNVIEAACHGRFKETGHSLVLADMLRHPYIQSSFIETFLGIQHEYMNVTAETDRVDVALKGKDTFVIVENKVNGADEQESQIYRYVHEIGMEKYGYRITDVYVVYLNPSNHENPSEYSLCDENKNNNVFDALGADHYTVQSYKYDIVNWLRNISIEGEPHIMSALDQYVDFLEQKFHNSPLDKKMNTEIKKLIFKELDIENEPFSERMKALDDQTAKVKELMDALETLKLELRLEESHAMMRKWQKQIEQEGIPLYHDEHSFGIQLNNKVWLGIWDGDNNGKNHLPYWGLQLDSYKAGTMPELQNQIRNLLEKAGIVKYEEDKGFVAWNSTQKGVERFMSLYNAAKDSGLLPGE